MTSTSTLQWTDCSSSNGRTLITNNIWDKKKKRGYTHNIPQRPWRSQEENEDKEGYPTQTLEEEEDDGEEKKKVQQWCVSAITIYMVKSWKKKTRRCSNNSADETIIITSEDDIIITDNEIKK